MNPLPADILAIGLVLGVCFALQRYWGSESKRSGRRDRAAAAELRTRHAELARLGVLGPARSSPLLDPAVIDRPGLRGNQSPNDPPQSEAGSLWTRTFYDRKESARQLRLTLTKPRGADGALRRQVVVFHVRRAVPRTREAAFELPEMTAELFSREELDALVERSFAQAHSLLVEAAAGRAAAPLPFAAPAFSPRAFERTAAIVRPIREETQVGTIVGLGNDTRQLGKGPAFDDYFIDLDCDGRIERIWGSALQDEVKRTQVGPGDRVSVKYLGRKPVEVTEKGRTVERMKKLYLIQAAA